MGTSTINLGTIIQARMNSSRFPGKILRVIHDKTLLDHIMFRLSFLRHRTKVIIATTDSASDDIVESYCIENGFSYYRGNELNVLDRYYLCAKAHNFESIIRLTGDNPFLDIQELDRLIDLHLTAKSDFSHSFRSLPLGVGAEVFTFSALERSFLEARSPHHREHVDEYLLENPEEFKTVELIVKGPKNQPEVRLTVDTEEDYRRACFIAEHANSEPVTTEEAINLCTQFV